MIEQKLGQSSLFNTFFYIHVPYAPTVNHKDKQILSRLGLFKVMRLYFVLQQQNTLLTFLCDINLWLIEGPHLLLASVTLVLMLATAIRGRSRGQTYLSSCSLGCSDIYWITNPKCEPCGGTARLPAAWHVFKYERKQKVSSAWKNTNLS